MTGERRLPVQRWHWVYISHRNNAGSWLLLDLVSVTNKTSLSHFSKFLHADFWSNLQSYFIFPEEWASLTSDHSLRTRWEQLLGKDVFIVSTHLLGNDTLGTKEGMTPVSSLEKNPKHKNLLSQAVLPRCRDQKRTSWFGEQNLIRSRDFFCLLFVDDLLFTFPSSISAPVEWRMSSLSRLVNRGRVGGPGNMWHPLRSKGWNCPAVMTLYLWKL